MLTSVSFGFKNELNLGYHQLHQSRVHYDKNKLQLTSRQEKKKK